MHEVIISLAKAAILVALQQADTFNLIQALESYPELKEHAAVFVTLSNSDNSLRGCIGSLQAYQPLYKDIIYNAQAAAMKDNRFKPLTLKEFKNIHIEISVLSKAKILHYQDRNDLKKKIKPLQDGVILKYQGKSATYLPQVWEQLPTFHTFFNGLCLKAKLAENCLSEHPQIFTYHVTIYKEKL